MKHSILHIVLITCVAFTSLTSCAQTRYFSQLAELPGVESVYIGRSVMMLAGDNILSNVSDQVDLDIRNIQSIEVITNEDGSTATVSRLVSMSSEIINRLNMEVVVDQRCDDERATIYVQPTDSTYVTFTKMVVLNYDQYDFSLVFINGKISNTNITGEAITDDDDDSDE